MEGTNNPEIVRMFRYKAPDDTVIRYYVDHEGSHLEGTYNGETKIVCTEPVHIKFAPSSPLTEMANLLLARINGYLNVYDPHPVGSRKRVKSYYDRFDPVALHAIRRALCNVATDKKEIHYCLG